MIKISLAASQFLARINPVKMDMHLQKLINKNELNITYAKNKAVVKHSLGFIPEDIEVSKHDDRDILDNITSLLDTPAESNVTRIDLVLVHRSLMKTLLDSIVKYNYKENVSKNSNNIGTIFGVPFFDFEDEFEMWKIITDHTRDGHIPNYRVLVPSEG